MHPRVSLRHNSRIMNILQPPGQRRPFQDNTANCRNILRYLPVYGAETRRFIANLRADQELLRLVNATYRPIYVQEEDATVPGLPVGVYK